jgi:diguanylate cyclase (GGDEF)-like protein
VLLADDDAGARLVVLICSIAFATAIAHGFCMRQGRALLLLTLLYVPVLAALVLASGASTAAAAIGIYLAYLLLLLRRSHREYQERLDLDDDLRRQRDLFELQSRRDGLTGLANRRHFAAALDALVEGARHHADPFALLILDLDHFKAINDRHGHIIGDACLRGFAERLQLAFDNPSELVARLGGEEFAVLIPNLDEDAAAERGEAFRQQMAGSPLLLPDLAIGLTVSIGVGAFGPRHPGDSDAFFSAVDQALYRAKAGGRNAVCRGTGSGASWAVIPDHRGHRFRGIVGSYKTLMLEQLRRRRTSWLPPTLREETTIDVSPEGLYASAQRGLAINSGGLKPAPDCPQSSVKPWRGRQIPGGSTTCRSELATTGNTGRRHFNQPALHQVGAVRRSQWRSRHP